MRISSTVIGTIRAELARARISYTQVADRLGVTRQAMTRRMSGDTPFRVDEIATIASMCGVTVGALVDDRCTDGGAA